ncbi:GGDEF domain-containing protein [Tunturibacter empetritectus]|uniref:diguanylate cyclase n=1 Tax=Tunturiibacter lichenicola TaxID=2051959 RepID=A0A7W8N231_9BACT|nr:GGDEF domain-containing protein [Edaphobacter lichenicola]MBB5342947.1 diguanylate cyclase (GGDEF)-like protein [Edaphobacter lichenicola]
MSFIASIDVGTLLGCQIVLTLVYAIVFFCMKSIYPYLRGAGSVALAFFAATISNILLLLSGSIPAFFSIGLAHCLLLSAFVLFYTGVLHFFKSTRTIRYAWALTYFTSALIFYLVLSHDHTRALAYVIAVSFFLVRGVIALEIFRHAADRIFLKIFAFLMAAYAIFALNRVIFLLIYGAPPNPEQRNFLQTVSVLFSVSFAFLIGLSFLLMLCGDLLTLVKDESERDLLSGVLNRRGIEQRLDTELKRAERGGHNLSIALIDIDHFKTINDHAGHAAGDTALRDVVSAISSRMRAYDSLGRFGGDEFLLIFPNTSSTDALTVSSRIEQSVRELSSPGAELSLTISIGLTQAAPGEIAGPFLARADKALYNAKNAGRNCCRVLLHGTDAEAGSERVILPPSRSNLLQQ